jgi:hypothetical protein
LPKPIAYPLIFPIHRGAWKGNSQKLNFRVTAFYEVRYPQVMPKEQ